MTSQLDLGSSIPAARTAVGQRTATSRVVHLVGSLPKDLAPDQRTRMQWVLDRSGGARLSAVPCDDDPSWIIEYLRSRAQVPAFEVVRDGECADYADIPVYRVRQGHRLTIEDVSLGRPEEVYRAVTTWRELGGPAALPPVQASVPSPLDLAMFTLGDPPRVLRHFPVFERMIATEVAEIAHRHGPGEVVLQLESPVVLYLLHRAPRPARSAIAHLLAHQLARVIVSAPRSARWTLHLCYGDLGHVSLFGPEDLGPAVLVANALAAHLRTYGRRMPTVHIPMAHGDQPPLVDAAAYAPLHGLARGIGVIAGCVDERQPELSAKALSFAETALGQRVVGVAAACGHGRRTPTEAAFNIELARLLAGS
ncbi:hypothetical protein [Saccharopolyspora spinosa]|uniref:Methionine synthase n=1 Tax=Saccharopolyspora spinosa TaxID=60894 RepID=A0A2N3Y7E8_SACSN|nr:hypothetical protein [Saccharopolyspora spinosa]PKW18864.1 hypothetical protein A8926_7001 [Saccharopolyspora spinosa]